MKTRSNARTPNNSTAALRLRQHQPPRRTVRPRGAPSFHLRPLRGGAGSRLAGPCLYMCQPPGCPRAAIFWPGPPLPQAGRARLGGHTALPPPHATRHHTTCDLRIPANRRVATDPWVPDRYSDRRGRPLFSASLALPGFPRRRITSSRGETVSSPAPLMRKRRGQDKGGFGGGDKFAVWRIERQFRATIFR
jgi:hypothetical protein